MSFDGPLKKTTRTNAYLHQAIDNNVFTANNRPNAIFIPTAGNLTVILSGDVASNGVVNSSQSVTFTNIQPGLHNIQCAKIISAPAGSVALK